ncbi:hypothetical protein SISSUDRAFT_345054 [Sistotremastrum suecicum HHB10207 ss-3]|uniref:Uncharacterized protein n=1 Tax=Sistotremastrum suecicum HHB10207 ss-3 TaxID=1314776 RepID=A0A166J0P5_9AGAM|nr:hypothetical protein SISSUDRAFT_345054 [Sistotremastrum suecicum HHB10207 ss-3]
MPSDAPQPANHGFILQGTDKLFFGHLALYKVEAHQWQLVISGDVPSDIMEKIRAQRKKDPKSYLFLTNKIPTLLQDLLDAKQFEALIYVGIPKGATDPPPIIYNFKLTNIKVLSETSLLKQELIPYPRFTMPFYVYGTEKQRHIQHVLTEYKNIQLMSDQVTISGVKFAGEGPVYAHFNLPESAMQPFPEKVPDNFFFSPGRVFTSVTFSKDLDARQIIGWGNVTLGQTVFIDSSTINYVPKAGEGGHPPGHLSL